MPSRYSQDGGSGSVADVAWEPGELMTITPRLTELRSDWVGSNVLASKDSWVPEVAGCVDNANKNGQDLRLEGPVASKANILAGWDLSTLPTGVTITEAVFTLTLKTAPTVATTVGGNLHLIPIANETWSETGATCSNQPPAEGTTLGNLFLTDTAVLGTQYEFILPAAALTRIGARMGVGTFSLKLVGDTLTTGRATFESKDEGTSNELGPRLRITFNKVVSL